MVTGKAIKKFLDAGINSIPVSKDKIPTVKAWKKYMSEKVVPVDMAGEGFGLICGKVSENMEVVDIDLKYDLTGDLYERYISLIEDNDPELLTKLMIIQTPTGGYHWVYRCETIQGNQKLASRPTTPEEQAKNSREKVKVLIETRGEGGYIAFIPPKYEVKQGRFGDIPVITPEQRDLLMACAREFDEVPQVATAPAAAKMQPAQGKTPWDDYNERVTCHDILVQHGWTFVYEDSQRIYMKRAGQTATRYSGNILKADNLFRAWTSSSEFEPEKTYTSSGIFTVLEHNGDWSAAARALLDMGYGDRIQNTTTHEEYHEARQQPPVISVKEELDYTRYLPDVEEDDKYLEAVRSGTLAMGLTTGSPALDQYFLLKRGTFNVVIGDSNIGKTSSILHEKVCSAVVHGWKSVIIPMEDPTGKIKKKIMEFYMLKKLPDMDKGELDEARNFLEEMFIVLKGRGGDIQTIPQALNILYKIMDKHEIDDVMIDPYSAFDKDLKGGVSEHNYDYRIAGDIINFCTRTDTCVTLNSHTGTNSRRTRTKDDEGYLTAPFMADVEGGGKWTNRADRVVIQHRKVDHKDPAIRTCMEFVLAKERDLETGGWLHDRDNPTRFFLQPNMCEYVIDSEASIIQRWKADRRMADMMSLKDYKEPQQLSFNPDDHVNVPDSSEDNDLPF